MNKYRCKVCNELINISKADVVNASQYGVIYRCPKCASGTVWAMVTKRKL